MAGKYSAIWERLKAKGKCEIAAPKGLHARIIKGVIAAKYKDLAYKFLLSEDNKKAKISYCRKENIVQFTLIKTIGLDDL